MKKRLLSIVMAMAMTMSLLPAAAFATETPQEPAPQQETPVVEQTVAPTEPAEDDVAQVGTTYYKTLGEAIATAQDGSTIQLLKEQNLSALVGLKKNLTFVAPNIARGTAAFVASSNVTLENITATIQGTDVTISNLPRHNGAAIRIENGSTVTMNSCNLTVEKLSRGFVSGTDDSNKLILNNTTVTGKTIDGNFTNGGQLEMTSSTVNASDCLNFGFSLKALTMTKSTATLKNIGYAGLCIDGDTTTGCTENKFVMDADSLMSITSSGSALPFQSKWTPSYAPIELGFKGNVSVNIADLSKLPLTGNVNSKGEPINYIHVHGTNATINGVAGSMAANGGTNYYLTESAMAENSVAKVATKYYATLPEAVAAAQDGETVTLLKDVTEDITVAKGKSLTLNLNNKKLTNVTSDTIRVELGAELTIAGQGTVDNVTHAKAAIWNNGTVHMNGGTFTRSKENGSNATESGGNSFYVAVNHGTMTVDGATVQGTSGFSSLFENGYYSFGTKEERSGYVQDTNAENPFLTIENGKFDGGLNTIKNDDNGVLVINNGVFTNAHQMCLMNWHKATINGGSFSVTNDASYAIKNCGNSNLANDIGELSITNGIFNAAINKSKDAAMPTISGGTFTSDPNAYLADGKVAVQKDSKWVVGAATTGVTLNQSTASLYYNKAPNTVQLTATVVPTDAVNGAVTWSTSDGNIATVDQNGLVTAVSSGTATITATAGGQTATCEVTVSYKSSPRPTPNPTPNPDPKPEVKPDPVVPTTPTAPVEPTVPDVKPGESIQETKPDGTQVEASKDANGNTSITETKPDGTVTETNKDAAGNTTITETRPDGTKVEANKDAAGNSTVTETRPDGSTVKSEETASGDKTVTETKADGSSVMSEEKANGDKAITETKADGSSVKTEEKANGDKAVTETKADGSSVATTETATGSTGRVETDAAGTVKAEAQVSNQAVEAAKAEDKPVQLPVEVPSVKADDTQQVAAQVEVAVPAGGAKVELPVENVTAGTVVVIVHADGSEEIVKKSVISDNGVVMNLEENVTLKVVDNSKDFADVNENAWSNNAIDYVSSRELFKGTSETTFTPKADTTRAEIMTVLARMENADTEGDALKKGMEWAVQNGVSDGSNPKSTMTRQELATMMYRLAGKPDAGAALEDSDAEGVASWASQAMAWAVNNGILTGFSDGSLAPTSTATREQVAIMVQRYCAAMI